MSNVRKFISEIQKVRSSGIATEGSYRSALSELILGIDNNSTVINEGKRIECGAPDLVIQKSDLTVGYLEQKELGQKLRNFTGDNKEQQKRYLAALPNLIYTNCLDWDFYRSGELISTVKIGELDQDEIKTKEVNFAKLEQYLFDFIQHKPQRINDPRELAERMADKTKLVKHIIFESLKIKSSENKFLVEQYETVKEHLIHDITRIQFADIYAETIAFGLLTARLEEESDNFVRKNVRDLLPKNNPFLKGIFTYISDSYSNNAISWIIDDLTEIFKICDIKSIRREFGNLVGKSDPFFHFYETFLNRYNPEERVSKGVWYTPESVVKFIIRAVDDALINEFELSEGLADISKVKIQNRPDEDHRVQILDPATGTGTFLAETINQIYKKKQSMPQSLLSDYVQFDMIPRIHGFEILMAPYAVCHMKLGRIIHKLMGKSNNENSRLQIYLTNAIEKVQKSDKPLGFLEWLSQETDGANNIKQNLPIMCVIGNPPYNAKDGVPKDDWLADLMEDYLREPNTKIKLQATQKRTIYDLYVKFIRSASYWIDKNGEGIMAFITNHGYMNNLVFRGMRWHLMKTFDKIWILDLHGNSRRKEKSPDGKPDENVFPIQTGVAIIIAVKKTKDTSLAKIFLGDFWGTQESKFSILEKETIYGDLFEEITPCAPHYYFQKIDYQKFNQYNEGFYLREIFTENSVGIVTARDNFTVDISSKELTDRLKDFVSMEIEEARSKYALGRDSSWTIKSAQEDIGEFDQNRVVKMCYRPFDNRYTYYTGNNGGIISRPANKIMSHLIVNKMEKKDENIALLVSGQQGAIGFRHVFVSNLIAESCVVSNLPGESNHVFPLYTHKDWGTSKEKTINLDFKIQNKITEIAANHQTYGSPDETAIFDYIYGVLHCPNYRKTYGEFLSKDFPKIPYPHDSNTFWYVSTKGTKLRNLHLMKESEIGETPYLLSEGSNVIDKVTFKDNKIWINENQWFENVPEVSWYFQIGSYRPAERWLKDRKGTKLNPSDFIHYCKLLKILFETNRIMNTIEMEL